MLNKSSISYISRLLKFKHYPELLPNRCSPSFLIQLSLSKPDSKWLASTSTLVFTMLVREGMGAFFTGLRISLIRDVPFSGIFYPIYSFFRSELTDLYGYEMGKGGSQADRMKAIAVISSLSSFLANIVSCTVTHPLDLIRTRAYFKYYNTD